ncbi:class I SAM-dependent methyltransferase, partial [Candidatus Magnetobacterium casense]
MVKVLPDGAGVLDVGCGSGAIYEELLHRGFGSSRPYIGGDVSTRMLEIAHNRFPTTQFLAMDVFNLPFRDHSQPIVLCINVLQHLPGYMIALAELVRVTGRLLYVATWFNSGNEDNIRLVPSPWGPDFYQ